MARRCKYCEGIIPSERKASSVYCSQECYYEAKKDRSNSVYKKLKEPLDEIKKNEGILAIFYPLFDKKREVHFDDLEAYKFNWGIANGETQYSNKLCKIIGQYAYYLNPQTKQVSIWKLK